MDEISVQKEFDFLAEYKEKFIARAKDALRCGSFKPIVAVDFQRIDNEVVIDLTHSLYSVESALLAVDPDTANLAYNETLPIRYVDPKNILALLKSHSERFTIKEVLSLPIQRVCCCCEKAKQSSKILIDELLEKTLQNCPYEIKNSKYVWNYKIDGNVIVLTIRQGKPNVENRPRPYQNLD